MNTAGAFLITATASEELKTRYSLVHILPAHPTIIICPGGWPARSFFEPLQSALADLVYPAEIALTDFTTFDPLSPITTNPDVISLRTRLQSLTDAEGKQIVLLMHSYGGVYGPASVAGLSIREMQSKGLNGGVLALIFFAAFNTKKGVSAMDAQGFGHSEGGKTPDWAHYDRETGLVTLTKAKELLYHDLLETEAEERVKALPAMPIACFMSKASYDPYDDEWYKGAFGYVFCAQDRMLPYEAQKMYADQAGVIRSRVLENRSHSPHLEQPRVLAQLVIDIIGELISDLKA